MVPKRHEATAAEAEEIDDVERPIDLEVRLMYLVNEGDLDKIKELLDSGINVNFKDSDGRTAIHIAACNGLTDVVSLFLDRGSELDPSDCLGGFRNLNTWLEAKKMKENFKIWKPSETIREAERGVAWVFFLLLFYFGWEGLGWICVNCFWVKWDSMGF